MEIQISPGGPKLKHKGMCTKFQVYAICGLEGARWHGGGGATFSIMTNLVEVRKEAA